MTRAVFSVVVIVSLGAVVCLNASPQEGGDSLSKALAILKSSRPLDTESLTIKPLDPPISEFSRWLIGSNWGGRHLWFNAKQNEWRSYTGSVFIITFKENGQCWILSGTANESGGDVRRTSSTWREVEGGVEVADMIHHRNVVLELRGAFNKSKLSANRSFEGVSRPIARGSERERFELRRDWGLQLDPPTIYYRAYCWSLAIPGRGKYTRADP